MANYRPMAGSPLSEENRGPVATMRPPSLLRSPSLSKRRALELISNIFKKKKDRLDNKNGEKGFVESNPTSGRRRSTPIFRAHSPDRQTLSKPQLSMRNRRASPITPITGSHTTAFIGSPPFEQDTPNMRSRRQTPTTSRPPVAMNSWSPLSSHSPDLQYQSYNSLFSNSPISPRVRSIDEDIEALTLSRQDNPFLCTQLERISATSGLYCDFLSVSEVSLSTTTLSCLANSTHDSSLEPGPSTAAIRSGRGGGFVATDAVQSPSSPKHHSESLLSIELDEILSGCGAEQSVHEHLIRSPPPQFPRKLSEFILPVVGSPIRTLSLKHRSNQPSSSSQPHLNQSRGRSRHQSAQFNSQLLSPLRSRSATQQAAATTTTLSIRPELTGSANSYLDSHLI